MPLVEFVGNREAVPEAAIEPAPGSVIARLHAASVDDRTLKGVARLALQQLQDAAVNLFYHRRPPKGSRLLNLGCGEDHYPGWVNADRFRTAFLISRLGGLLRGQYRLPGWVLDARARWNCPDDYWEGIYTEHMLEHLSYDEVIGTLREMLRTLQPGGWARIVLPDLRHYVDFYNGTRVDEEFASRFAYGAEAIAFLTQKWGHVSVWDATLLSEVLKEIGFVKISEVSYRRGTDQRLLRDSLRRQHESLYVEARKP